MRAFIAIVPPASVTQHIHELCDVIRSIAPALHCEHAAKLHFTLEFLGEKDEPWLQACRDALAPVAAATAPFQVTLRSIEFFPGTSAPRIIWAGSQPDENMPMCSLASVVRQASARLGHRGDQKQFHPHITLARVKTHLSQTAVGRIAALTFDPLTFTCTEVSLIQSILHAHGSEYETLGTIPLRHEV